MPGRELLVLVRIPFSILGGRRDRRSELSKSLATATGRTHISVGDILREEAEKDSDQGKEVAGAIGVGCLIAAVSGKAPSRISRVLG